MSSFNVIKNKDCKKDDTNYEQQLLFTSVGPTFDLIPVTTRNIKPFKNWNQVEQMFDFVV